MFFTKRDDTKCASLCVAEILYTIRLVREKVRYWFCTQKNDKYWSNLYIDKCTNIHILRFSSRKLLSLLIDYFKISSYHGSITNKIEAQIFLLYFYRSYSEIQWLLVNNTLVFSNNPINPVPVKCIYNTEPDLAVVAYLCVWYFSSYSNPLYMPFYPSFLSMYSALIYCLKWIKRKMIKHNFARKRTSIVWGW